MSLSYEFLTGNDATKVEKHNKSYLFLFPGYNEEKSAQYSVSFGSGVYFIECWGASGSLGKGAYTNGTITFSKNTKLYLFLGKSIGFFNCIPPTAIVYLGCYGGGATDIRLTNDPFYEFDSLKSRIMVAAGGASEEYYKGSGGNGGALEGENGITGAINTVTFGATQTQGGRINNYREVKGSFGLAGYITSKNDFGGVGGGGYYGGCSMTNAGSGSGGSSFISGHIGCNAINEKGSHTGQPIHYSHYLFSNSSMSSGSDFIPNGKGEIEKGHTSDGMVKITIIKFNHLSYFRPRNSSVSIKLLLMMLFYS